MKQIPAVKQMKFGTKILLIVFTLLLIIFTCAILYQGYQTQKTYLRSEIRRSRVITTFSDQIRRFVSGLRRAEVFDEHDLLKEYTEAFDKGKQYDETRIFMTIPVVGAWTAARAKADELGYTFRVIRNEPRNPRHEPRNGLEEAVIHYLEGRGGIEEIQAAGGVIVFPENLDPAEQVMEIGVIFQGNETTNSVEGEKTLEMDAIRFFSAVTLSKDCLVCHGEPKGEIDIMGFPKEGWKENEVRGAFEIIAPLAPMRKEVSEVVRNNIAAGIILFIIASGVFTLIMRKTFSEPIEKIVEYCRRIEKGDFQATLDTDREDEIGEIAYNLNNSIQALARIIKKLVDISATLFHSSDELSSTSNKLSDSSTQMNKQSDTVAAAAEEVSASVRTVAASAEESSTGISNIAAMTEEMSSSARNVADFAGKTSTRVQNMADNAERMANGARNVAAGVEEMSASLNEVARSTGKASKISMDALKRSNALNQKMGSLNDVSRQIEKFVVMIKGIADQTNMLALNATIEAAGAGEAGKGFSVVAGEVKALAKQSAETGDEIAERVEVIQESIRDALSAIEAVGKVINEITDINHTIASAVEEQSATAEEISKNVAGNAGMVEQVSRLSQESSDLISEISRAAEESSKAADEVSKSINEITNGVKDIARAINEASTGVSGISEYIQEITNVSRDIETSASITRQSASDLSVHSKKLSKVIRSFDVGKEKFDIGMVKSIHLSWRSRLEGLLRGSETLSLEEVTSDHECEFGKWLFGPEGQKYKDLPVFTQIQKEHHEVHRIARKIVEYHSRGQEDKAEELKNDFERARERMFDQLDAFYID